MLVSLCKKYKELLNEIKDAFRIDDALEWGKDMISNFISGIWKKAKDLWDTVTSVLGGVADVIAFSEPKKGPLSNFHTYAPDMMKLFAQGIKDNEHLVTDQISKSFDFGDAITNEATVQTDTGRTDRPGFGSLVVNVYGTENQSVQELSREVIREINKQMRTKGLAYAK